MTATPSWTATRLARAAVLAAPVALGVVAIFMLAQSFGWIVALLPGLADACAPCVDPANGGSPLGNAVGAASAAGAAAGAAYSNSSQGYDPRNPYNDPQETSRLAREAREAMDPRNSPGAREARDTAGGHYTGAPSHGVGQSYNPRPTPTAAPPKSFTETVRSDRGWNRYGPRWPAPTPTPGQGH